MVRTAPCDWPLTLIEPCAELDALDEEPRTVVETMATSLLWRWTGKVYGPCETRVRPARSDCSGSTYRGTQPRWQPVLIDGAWRNVSCGYCGDLCLCDRLYAVRLPGPIASIVDVTVDGATVDPAAYRVDDHAYLVREDGESWPVANDLTKPEGEEGTWTVTYTRGIEVPAAGKVAAGVLACEMAKALSGSTECQLPQRIQTITREGVTVGVVDPFEGLEQGRTGIWLVDSWVASITGTKQRSRVFSPDQPRVSRETSSGAS